MAASKPLRILHVAQPALAGGLESVIQTLAIGQRAQGIEVHVGAVLDEGHEGHPFLAPLTQAGVPVHTVSLRPRAYLAERRWMRGLLQQLWPDVVHTHGYRVDVLDSPVARKMGIPTVTTKHGSSVMGGRGVIYEWLQSRVNRKHDAVIVVSRALVELTRSEGVAEKAIHLVPNGWADITGRMSRAGARERLGLPADGLILGWVARMILIKGGDVFAQALGLIRDLPVTVAIIGDGPERARIESIVASVGIADRCRFLGEVTPAAPLFPAFDIFVLSSRSEGTPMVLFEAMASGAAVVATAVGGVPDVLGDGAWLVPPEDPPALAQALREALSNPAARGQRVVSAKKRLEDYALEPWVAAHERIYRSLVG